MSKTPEGSTAAAAAAEARVEAASTPEEKEIAEYAKKFQENFELNLMIPADEEEWPHHVDFRREGYATLDFLTSDASNEARFRAVVHCGKDYTPEEQAAIMQRFAKMVVSQENPAPGTGAGLRLKYGEGKMAHNEWTGADEIITGENALAHSASPRGRLRNAENLLALTVSQTRLELEKITTDKPIVELTPSQLAAREDFDFRVEQILNESPRRPEQLKQAVRNIEQRMHQTIVDNAPEQVMPITAPEKMAATLERKQPFSERMVKAFRDNPELAKQAALATLNMIGSVTGLKGYVEVPRYLRQRFAVHGFLGMGGLSSAIEGVIAAKQNEDGKAGGKAEIRSTEARLRLEKKLSMVREAGPEGANNEYRERLQKIVEEFGVRGDHNKKIIDGRIKILLDCHTTTKISGMQASKEALNSFLVASGAYGLRGLSSGVLDIASRYRDLKLERRHSAEKDVSLFRDVIAASVVKNFRELALGGGQESRAARNLTRAQAAMRIARWVGIAATVEGVGFGDFKPLAGADKIVENIGQGGYNAGLGAYRLLEGFQGKMSWSEIGDRGLTTAGHMVTGLGEAAMHGAKESLSRIAHNLTPREHWERMGQKLGFTPEQTDSLLHGAGVVPVAEAAHNAPATLHETPLRAAEVGHGKSATSELHPKGADRQAAMEARRAAIHDRLNRALPESHKASTPETPRTPAVEAPKAAAAEAPKAATPRVEAPKTAPVEAPKIETPPPVETPKIPHTTVTAEYVGTRNHDRASKLIEDVRAAVNGEKYHIGVTDAQGHKAEGDFALPGRTSLEVGDGHTTFFVDHDKVFSAEMSVQEDGSIAIDVGDGRGKQKLTSFLERFTAVVNKYRSQQLSDDFSIFSTEPRVQAIDFMRQNLLTKQEEK